MKKLRTFFWAVAFLAAGTFFLAGIKELKVLANNSPQTLPFSQNWTANLITVNDDWSPVMGIEGFLGQDITAGTGTDARTLLTTSAAVNDLDAIANQTNPNTLTTGGVAEFDGVANPTVALQGSGTADAPHLVVYLNTTGQSNVRVAYNARDIDGSVDNAIQQINTQYRIGSTGDFINVQAGYIADATTGPSTATLVTPVAVTLPAAANNQPVVQVRIMSTNAAGSDEWVGIDDISVTTVATPAPNRTSLDFNGDGRSDWAISRNSGGLITWWIQNNGTTGQAVAQWGLDNDRVAPADYDGDGRTDIAVYRFGAPTVAAFYILQSQTNTVRVDTFGQTGDRPTTVGDYDGDGKADVSVYRPGATVGAQSFFFYRGTLNNPSGNVTYGPWGLNGDVEAPGDYDGDGKFDFCIRRGIVDVPNIYDGDGKFDFLIRRGIGGGAGQFILLRSTDSGVEYVNWGLATDAIVPGDYDGDGRMDFCVARSNAGAGNFYILERDGGGTGASPIVFGNVNTDFIGTGDYDGDGRQDIAVWRPNVDPTQNFFYVLRSSSGALQTFEWGQSGDEPLSEWNVTQD